MGKHKKHKKEKREKREDGSVKRERGRVKKEETSDADLVSEFYSQMKDQSVDVRLERALDRHTTKTLAKSLESHEERQARRMAKKTTKRERELAAKTGMNVVKKSFILYDEGDNPFNDERLKETFLWKKKFEKDGLEHLSKNEKREVIKQRQVKLEKEVYEARVQRHNRELERALHEQEIEELQREREAVHYNEWLKKEDEFQLRQIRTRSKLRITNNRGKPIDFLARYIYATDPFEYDKDDAELCDEEEQTVDELAGYDDPLTIIRTTVKTVDDLEDILDDVIVYKKLVTKQRVKITKDIDDIDAWPVIPGDEERLNTQQKKQQKLQRKLATYGIHLEFWNDIEVVIVELVKEQEKIEFRSAEQRRAINTSVYTKVNQMFQNQSAEKLTVLKNNITSKIANAGPGVDIPYWEGLLQQLNSHEARARLEERHDNHLKKNFGHIRTEQQRTEMEMAVYKHRITTLANAEAGVESQTEKELRERLEQEKQEKQCKSVYKKREYSPDRLVEDISDRDYPLQRLHASLGESQLEVPECGGKDFWDMDGDVSEKFRDLKVKEEEEARIKKEAEEAEQASTSAMAAPNQIPIKQEADGLAGVKKDLKDDGMGFKDEISGKSLGLTYDWADKYRPRRPKYFNRVNTGFEWNRYNQTHYDYDTPPPKVVTGYKFNIYYPDMIDKRNVPTYNIFTDNTNPEYCVLIITAGPPYEDLAFRIVNKKIDTLERHGFVCEFRGGVFRLHFTYKRLKYKR